MVPLASCAVAWAKEKTCPIVSGLTSAGVVVPAGKPTSVPITVEELARADNATTTYFSPTGNWQGAKKCHAATVIVVLTETETDEPFDMLGVHAALPFGIPNDNTPCPSAAVSGLRTCAVTICPAPVLVCGD